MDDAALTGSLAGGDADGLLAVFDAYGDRLHGYAAFLLGDAGTAGDAVLDALLVGADAAGGLADPTRLRPWLYALTRNECLRRRPGGQPRPADGAEAVELADRHRMAPAEVAAVLGLPAEDADRLRRHRHASDSRRSALGAGAGVDADELLPGAGGPPRPAEVDGGEPVPRQREEAGPRGGGTLPRLRAALAAGAGPGGARRRAELTRRARPFEPDGFPVPLDRRRLSAAALAWSAAAVVLLALGMLVVLPVGGGDAVGAAPAGPVPAADPPAAPADETRPVPTLAAGPLAAEVQPDRGADRRPAASARRPASQPPAASGPSVPGSDDRPGRPRTVLSMSWSPRPDPGCDSWTAELRARLYGRGAAGVTEARATVTGAGDQLTVTLRPDGDEWRGRLPGLPTDRPLTLTVRAGSADGGAVEASSRLAFSCG